MHKVEKNLTHLTVGGNKINYPGEVDTPTADMLLVNLMLNSIVSTMNAKFMCINIYNFYLNISGRIGISQAEADQHSSSERDESCERPTLTRNRQVGQEDQSTP